MRALGPRVVLVTSLVTDETPADAVDLMACDGTSRHRLRTPKLPVAAHGAGDAIAALFMAHYLRSGAVEGAVATALSRAAASVFGILKRTAEIGDRGNGADRGAGRIGQSQRELSRRTVVRSSDG